MSEIFSERLKEAIRESGLTQTVLAERAELSSAYISELKSGGRANPSRVIIERIARALDKPTEYFFSEKEVNGRISQSTKMEEHTCGPTDLECFRRLVQSVEPDDVLLLLAEAATEASLREYARVVFGEIRKRKTHPNIHLNRKP